MNKYSILTRIFKIALILAVASSFAACANTQHQISIEPKLYIKPVNLGKGNKVSLKVVDGRSKFALFDQDGAAMLGFGGSMNKDTIVPKSGISDPIAAEVSAGLQQLGFRPARGVKLARSLVVNVVQLKIKYQSFVVEGKAHTRLKTTIKVFARNGRKKYKNTYRFTMGKSGTTLIGTFKNEQFVNKGLSLALKRIFEDKKLWFFLSK